MPGWQQDAPALLKRLGAMSNHPWLVLRYFEDNVVYWCILSQCTSTYSGWVTAEKSYIAFQNCYILSSHSYPIFGKNCIHTRFFKNHICYIYLFVRVVRLTARVQASCSMPIPAFRCDFRAIRQWSWHMAPMMRWAVQVKKIHFLWELRKVHLWQCHMNTSHSESESIEFCKLYCCNSLPCTLMPLSLLVSIVLVNHHWWM